MQNQRGFVGVGVLIAIIVAIVVLGGGAYYVMQQKAPTTNNQQTQTTTNAPATTTPVQNPTPVFTSPKGDTFKVGSEYTISWSSSQKSNQTVVPLYFADSACANVDLVGNGEQGRGCSALKLATVPLGSGTFQLNLKRGSSVLSRASLDQNHQGSFVLFLETPQSRIVSSPFTIADNDFTINSAYSDKKLYAPGETVRFSVGGITDTGESLTPELGFSASTFLEFGDNWGSQGEGIRREGVFDQTKKQWNFVTTAPLVPKADYDYRIFVYIKCSNQSVCQQKYVSPLEKDAVLKFNITSN